MKRIFGELCERETESSKTGKRKTSRKKVKEKMISKRLRTGDAILVSLFRGKINLFTKLHICRIILKRGLRIDVTGLLRYSLVTISKMLCELLIIVGIFF